jgi:hypothetical protein
MATSTRIIMLVYLRQALANAETERPLTPDRFRSTVLDRASQRLASCGSDGTVRIWDVRPRE